MNDHDAIGLAKLLAVRVDNSRQVDFCGYFRGRQNRIKPFPVEVVKNQLVPIGRDPAANGIGNRMVEAGGIGMRQYDENVHDRSFRLILKTPGHRWGSFSQQPYDHSQDGILDIISRSQKQIGKPTITACMHRQVPDSLTPPIQGDKTGTMTRQ
jgi:hypothetical protein